MAIRTVKIYTCDRNPLHRVESEEYPEGWRRVSRMDWEHEDGSNNEVWDLCKGCSSQFERFMQGDRATVDG